ncbi:MAG: DNA polymerase IV [Bacilli bacterium]|jgi:DNA polymerase-4|nr:DNA polymerase IV [Bacillota bacterium]NLI51837.1 DNA polymerase IV [Erysipelotrichaceae bacterium]HOE54175.1 DNA polymerase IV [Bacilli bacterium]HOQ70745.1 DNA polymerase IV [Bacilli bacterium]HPY79149.1 DNA polymerase IV [Bacilli bacterium]
MSKVILHIDLNAFFAACEVLRDPTLKGKPLIVGGANRRGIVSTASYEARKYGIHSAMPTYKALRLCPNLIIKEPDFKLYHHYSSLFFNYLKDHVSPLLEVASIDECYIDATERLKNNRNPIGFIKELQQTLLQEIGLGCSIGVAPTKFLAKMASNYKKPLGITIYRRRELANTLWKLPINEMYGIGKATAPRLLALDIKTIGDLATTEDPEVKKLLGKSFFTFKEWANGRGSDEVIAEEEDPKSIGHSSTFMFDTENYEEISALFKEMSNSVSERAKREGKVGLTIQIVMRYYNFENVNRSVTLNKPTNNAITIFYEAMKLFDKNYKDEPLRLVGVTLQNLSDEGSLVEQLSLFDDFNEKSKTEVIIELLNEEYDKPPFLRLSDLKRDD